MAVLVITVVYGKEQRARLEILNTIFPLDHAASFLEQPYGGLLLLETSLPPDEAAARIARFSSALIHRIIPTDAIVESELGAISSRILGLVPPGATPVAVECVRRGGRLSSSHRVEEEVGRLLKAGGHTIDLDKPGLIVRIDIIGDRTTISVRPPSGFRVGGEFSG